MRRRMEIQDCSLHVCTLFQGIKPQHRSRSQQAFIDVQQFSCCLHYWPRIITARYDTAPSCYHAVCHYTYGLRIVYTKLLDGCAQELTVLIVKRGKCLCHDIMRPEDNARFDFCGTQYQPLHSSLWEVSYGRV